MIFVRKIIDIKIIPLLTFIISSDFNFFDFVYKKREASPNFSCSWLNLVERFQIKLIYMFRKKIFLIPRWSSFFVQHPSININMYTYTVVYVYIYIYTYTFFDQLLSKNPHALIIFHCQISLIHPSAQSQMGQNFIRLFIPANSCPGNKIVYLNISIVYSQSQIL